jgi:hypothetical protein
MLTLSTFRRIRGFESGSRARRATRGAVIGALLSTLVLSGLASAQGTRITGAKKIYLGILDDAREEMANWEPGVAKERVIRPAFEKFGSAWRNIDYSSMPRQMTWTVAFDGRDLGQVKSQAVAEDGTSSASERFLTLVQKITTPFPDIPVIGASSQEFAGLMAIGPGKIRRPLVVVSKPYFRDPDSWKRLPTLPNRIAKLVRAAFRRDFPHVDRCKDEEVVQHNWEFPDSSLVLSPAYGSNKGSFLVKADLEAGDCGYVDDPDDPLSGPWYFVSAQGSARRIGSFMTLLDAGDYDNTRRSEVIFMLSQPEDTDGLILYDANLRKRASLTWTYH